MVIMDSASVFEISHVRRLPPAQLNVAVAEPGVLVSNSGSNDKQSGGEEAQLFKPYTSKGLVFKNRVVVAPMCMYSSVNGFVTQFHLAHLAQFAMHGAGAIIVEATAVQSCGRISPRDLGIYKDEHVAGLREVVSFVKSLSNVQMGIQLGHAGRKGSSYCPFIGGGHDVAVPVGQSLHHSAELSDLKNAAMVYEQTLSEEDKRSFQGHEIIAPSALAFGKLHTPREMSLDDIKGVIKSFVDGARRADQAGFDFIQLHAAHGYLLHQFLSPISNRRVDQYGGSFENRIRILVEILESIKEVWPEEKPIWIRFSCSDWVEGGWDVDDVVRLSCYLKERKLVDGIDCSAGGLSPQQKIPTIVEGYQAEYAKIVKSALQKVGNSHQVLVTAVGCITDPEYAEQLLRQGWADGVSIAREFLRRPSWINHAAFKLNAQVDRLPQYRRAKERPLK
ncbi:hypothetical protein MP228_008942 [Amoeboaphelidium protococcarum]|nr:hypothetical protein MP228_008942 [Amoeboaphelidium protococcarum]